MQHACGRQRFHAISHLMPRVRALNSVRNPVPEMIEAPTSVPQNAVWLLQQRKQQPQ